MSGYKNSDNDPRGAWSSWPMSQNKTYKQRAKAFFPIHNPKTDVWYPCNPDSVWRYASENNLEPNQKLRSETIEEYVRQDRIIFSENDTYVVYKTVDDLIEAIKSKKAPSNLRLGIFDKEKEKEYLEFWVNKKIGFISPRFKKFLSEARRLEKPISSWIVQPSEDMDWNSDVEPIQSGMNQEGTTLIQRIMGKKAFDYPKPLSLISSLIKQSTEPDDLVVDFFAGSATTGHAVMAVNEEDGGSRRFILVSSTEATTEEPDKNVCRDVAAKRLEKAINGYSFTMNKGRKNVEGLGGNFAYLRTRRIPSETIFLNIQHDQVWIALQLIHAEKVSGYDDGLKVQSLEIENGEGRELVAYIPKLTETALGKLERLLDGYTKIVIYSWQPALLKQRIGNPAITFEPIPQFLVDRFGAGGRS